MSDSTSESPSRFSIYVPDPQTRLNLGKPEAGDDPFGYPGLSLQADQHLFVDVSKNTLMQSGGGMYLQTSGKYYQFSASKTFTACRWNALYAATGMITLAAGAGHPPTTQDSTGDAPYFERYNNLDLHYRVEEVQNALKKLLFGDGWRDLQKTDQKTQLDWAKDAAYPADGLLGELSAMLTELGFDPTTHLKLHEQVLQALEWGGNRKTSNMKQSSDFGPLSSFDPYATTGFNDKKWTKGLAVVLQIGVFLRRLGDVLAMVVRSITNMEVVKRIKKALGAITAFTGFLGKFDPSDWEKYGGDVWNAVGKKWKDQAEREKYEVGQGEDTAAELISLCEVFDLTGEADTEIHVLDAESGKKKTIDLSPYLSDEPAVLVLTIGDEFSKIAVQKSGDGTLVLDGAGTKWDAGQGKWVDEDGDETELPPGFEESGGVVQLEGGGLFTASVTDHVSFTDRSFAEGKLEINVDGSTKDKDAQPVGGEDGKTRAENLAAVLSGMDGIESATADGAQVTIETKSSGPDAFIQVAANDEAQVELGVNGSSRGTGSGQMTASQLAKELAAVAGDYTATVVGSSVQVTHDKTGKDKSYLKISGPLTERLFGADPSEARGTSATMFDWLDSFDSAVGMVAGWPGTLGSMAYPAIQAVRQVADVWKQIEIGIKSIKMALLGIGWNQAIGLIAGNGPITLSTQAGIHNIASGITLVATAGHPKTGWGVDRTKFTPLIEPALYKFKKGEKAVFEWIKNKLDPPPESKKAGLSGCRVVSDSDVQLVARHNVRIVAGERVDAYTKTLNLTALTQMHLSSRTADVWLQGKQIRLGNEAGEGTQEPTESVNIEASTGQVRLTTKSFGIWADEKGSSIGLGSKRGQTPPKLDTTKAHLTIDGSKVAVGVLSGRAQKGVVVDGGNVTIDAPSTITLGAGNQTAVTVNNTGVTLSGKVDLAGALTVMGSPLPLAPMVVTSVPNTALAAAINKLKQLHLKITKQATVVMKSILALDKAIAGYESGLEAGTPLAVLMQELLIDPAVEKRAKQVKTLHALRRDWEIIVADAIPLAIEAITSKVNENKALFEVEVKN